MASCRSSPDCFPHRRVVVAELTCHPLDRALTVLVRALVSPALAQASEHVHSDPRARLQYCIEQVRIEASEGASLVAVCAPHGRAMLSQAQQTLERLESLQLLTRELAGSPLP